MSESVEFKGGTISTSRVVMLWLVFKGMVVSSKPGRPKYIHCVLTKGVMECREILLLHNAGVVALEIRTPLPVSDMAYTSVLSVPQWLSRVPAPGSLS